MKIKFRTVVVLVVLFLFSGSLSAQKFVKTNTDKETGTHSEAYRSFTFNGAWCWFSDPRAVYYEGNHKRTYSGWIDNFGDVHVGFYDHETGADRHPDNF